MTINTLSALIGSLQDADNDFDELINNYETLVDHVYLLRDYMSSKDTITHDQYNVIKFITNYRRINHDNTIYTRPHRHSLHCGPIMARCRAI